MIYFFYFILTCKPGTAALHTKHNGLYKIGMINQLTFVVFQFLKFNRLASEFNENKVVSVKMKLYHSLIVILSRKWI
jgi:hypothetical protein